MTMRKGLSLFIFAAMVGVAAVAQQVKPGPDVPASFCISPAEMKLYNMINEYRKRFDLPAIPLSRSLSYVATTHARDLFLHHPDVAPCNFHSWSGKGHWKPFCYPRDENKKNSVWDKPKELTSYKGKGFEIVYWENNPVSIDSIIPFWRSIDYFNSFLMNAGKWTGKTWNAIGVGIFENYAVAWFGEITDPLDPPIVCGTVVEKKTKPAKDTIHAATTDNKAVPPVPVAPKPKQGKQQPGQKKQPVPAVKADSLKAAQKNPASPVGKSDSLKADTVRTQTARTSKYYIIVKSQLPQSELKKYLQKYQGQGYPEAKIIEKDHKYRLSVLEFGDKAVADSALREVRKTIRDAWMMKY
jgi:hypothetical protein